MEKEIPPQFLYKQWCILMISDDNKTLMKKKAVCLKKKRVAIEKKQKNKKKWKRKPPPPESFFSKRYDAKLFYFLFALGVGLQPVKRKRIIEKWNVIE